MNAATVCIVGLVIFWIGYRYYSRYMANRVFGLRDDEPVPARELEDGVDYVPTNKHVLFGHHFSSIAGAAPIIGPAIAVVWGWVPAVIWVVLGTVFMGAVHDMSTLVISLRHKGRSIGHLAADVIGPRTRTLFLLVIFFLVLLVLAVFAKAITTLFIKHPGTVIPINVEIIVALVIGYVCYKRKVPLLWPSIGALVTLYGMVWVGVKVPVSLAPIFGEHTEIAWIVGLLVYSFVASVLPVWVLLQPRDYINSHQLFVGLFALVLGLLVSRPEITAPAFNAVPSDAPSWFPFLFVTIACGAISGFHGLVSSGTSSKQIMYAPDARFVGYGGMLGEGTLALIATLAVSAGLANWAEHYHSFSAASAGGLGNFVTGAASFLSALGLPMEPSKVVVAVLVISFAATSLDTGARIQRYIVQELGSIYGIKPLQNRYVAGLVAVVLPFLLLIGRQEGQLWHIFGSSNQLLAGLSLTVITVWLYRTGRPWLPLGIPMILVLAISGLAMGEQLSKYIRQEQYMLATVGSIILALEIWVVLEAVAAVRRGRDAVPQARAVE